MIDEIRKLIERYSHKGILVDTNILLLYLIGSFDLSLIPRFKRTVQFTAEDYNTLRLLLHPFQRLWTTPNVLTEVSNLSGHLNEPARASFFRMFAEKINTMEEHYINSVEVATQEEFPKIGLTDMGILELSRSECLILTDDFRLSQFLQTKGMDVINFNHIRPLGWE